MSVPVPEPISAPTAIVFATWIGLWVLYYGNEIFGRARFLEHRISARRVLFWLVRRDQIEEKIKSASRPGSGQILHGRRRTIGASDMGSGR